MYQSGLLLLIAVSLLVMPGTGSRSPAASTQSSLSELESKLMSQYAAIEEEIARPPRGIDHQADYYKVLREWQDQLAARFGDAALTVEEIVKIDTANAEKWRERLETLRLYAQPIGPPHQRTVFGSGEVRKRARVIDAPEAIYTDAARANHARGDVRLRLVLAADGTVKNVFPIKSLPHGLTESSMAAARQIKFEPAVRNEQKVSQFATFVYEFNKKDAAPYIPRTVF